MRSWLSVLITDAESKKVFDIPIAPSLYSLSNKMDNSLLAVRDINHKYIVVESIKREKVMLPINDNGKPDYLFMEQYIKYIILKLKTKYLKEK